MPVGLVQMLGIGGWSKRDPTNRSGTGWAQLSGLGEWVWKEGKTRALGFPGWGPHRRQNWNQWITAQWDSQCWILGGIRHNIKLFREKVIPFSIAF